MNDSPVIGSASFELRLKKERLKRELAETEREIRQSMEKAEADSGRATRGILGNFQRMSAGAKVGLVGLAGAIGLVLTGLFTLGVESFKMAGRMSSTAKDIGLSTTALQEWRYVVREAGGDASKMEAALGRFADMYRSAAAGLSQSDLDAFGALRISQEDLRKLGSVEAALDLVTSRVGELRSEGDKLAIVDQLGLEPLSEALLKGSADIERLKRDATDLGFVIDEELVDKAVEVNRKFESMSEIIGIQMAGAFLSLSDEVLAFTGHIADALTGLNNFLERFDRWKERISLQYGDEALQGLMSFDVVRFGRGAAGAIASGQAWDVGRAYENGENDNDDPALLRQRMATMDRETRARGQRELANPAADRRAARAAERDRRQEEREVARLAREATRNQRRFEDMVADSARDLLQSQEAFSRTAAERASVAIMALDQERQQLVRNLDRQVEDKQLSQRRRDQILAAADLVFATREAAIAQDLERDEIEERADLHSQYADFTAALLAAEGELAGSRQERLKIEKDLLELHQQERRAALENAAADQTLSEAKRAAARAALEQLGYLEGLENDAVDRRYAGPLERFRNDALSNAGRLDDAMQQVAVDGLKALNDGLVDAILNAKDLGEMFSNVSRQIIADLASIAIRRGITEPLAAALFGGGKDGGGIFSLFGRLISRAEGGMVTGPGTGTSDSILARLSNGEFVVRASQVAKHRSLLERINQGFPGFADGGLVGFGASERSDEAVVPAADFTRRAA